MNILVIGSGGREHALCWAIARSPLLTTLYAAPGNPGIAQHAQCLALDSEDQAGVVALCQRLAIDMVVVGPEAPLVAGLSDALQAAGIACFGPSAAAAQLEGSKGFTKDLCAAYTIPTAAYQRFTSRAAAHAYVAAQGVPIVLKYDGLAAGKGVVVAHSLEQAHQAVDQLLKDPKDALVIEAFLAGEEVSLFVLVDGTTCLPLGSAQDHKRVGEGDTGPNTGGMGAYSPAPLLTSERLTQALETIIKPTVRAMAERGTPFVGLLYAGLMLTKEGMFLIEYNCRFGDPETQVVLLRMNSDLLALLHATCKGQLQQWSQGQTIAWKPQAALGVVMAAQGYPGDYIKNSAINGIEQAQALPDVAVFHAGTKRDAQGVLRSAGGRVLTVCALGETLAQAQVQAYQAIAHIEWPEGFYRRDIGWRALG
jgi:phosphoribosylamine---glycine ligase